MINIRLKHINSNILRKYSIGFFIRPYLESKLGLWAKRETVKKRGIPILDEHFEPFRNEAWTWGVMKIGNRTGSSLFFMTYSIT
jgi:hypothetical protein